MKSFDNIPGLSMVEFCLTSTESVTVHNMVFDLFRINVIPECHKSTDGAGGRSRILRFGFDYDPPHVFLDCHEVEGIAAMLFDEKDVDSITINEYPPGHGIAPHIDSFSFDDTIYIYSLGSETVMEFRPPFTRNTVGRVEVPTNSLITMTGPARTTWTHSTLGVNKGLRYSIVGRKLRA